MKIIKLLFLFISISGFSQSKVGTVDIDFILSNMPELASAQEQVATYGKGLDADLNKKFEAYNAVVETYKAEQAGYTEAVKQQKQSEIAVLEEDITKFQQNGTQLVGIKRDEALRPLYNRIGIALEKVSKAEAFTQVLRIDDSIVYMDSNYDVTLKVLKELGIEVKEGE